MQVVFRVLHSIKHGVAARQSFFPDKAETFFTGDLRQGLLLTAQHPSHTDSISNRHAVTWLELNPSSGSRMRKTLLALIVSLAALLTGCASLLGPRQVEIPLSRLQEAIEQKFPTSNSLLSLFDIELKHPKLSLLPDKNRVRISMDTSIAPMLLNRVWTGSFTVSGHFALDAAGQAVVLASPKVEELTLQGESQAVMEQVRKVSNFFIEQFLQDVPLYRIDPDKLNYAGVRMKPTAINTQTDSIVVTFEPVK
jgi:hypothetical protein